MIRGLSGSLLSHDMLSSGGLLDQEQSRDATSEWVIRALRRWHQAVRGTLGPTAGARTVFDTIAAPLFAQLGYTTVPVGGHGPHVHAALECGGRPAAALVVTPWGTDLAAAWRDAVRHGIASGLRWSLAVNGPALRIVDARRSYSRRHAEFTIATALDDPMTGRAFYSLLNSAAMQERDGGSALDRAVLLSERFRTEVRASLQQGVLDALVELIGAFAAASRRRRANLAGTFDESLTVVYRVLFLLFAEARGLVPRWHPTFRDGYTIEALRHAVETEARPRGLWEALQAIARMAHRGCRAGSLRVAAFNGRLFSPVEAPLADSLPLDDSAVRRAMLALTTRKDAAGLRRISYGDLGVEHLGGIYERLLDFEPAHVAGSAPTLVRAERRKSTGSFYTPRSLTEYLVRRTLAPLADAAGSDAILSMRILDPAMGSGAFLVAACRYLASAYEQALLREGAADPGDIGEIERAGFRRAIAQRCLYGVDINPMAVQLGRLSLWLATLSADRPLTFLDHHLRAGNSLVGASIRDLLRQPPGHTRARATLLPLFGINDADDALASTIGARIAIASEPGDTLEQVRSKERVLATVVDSSAPLARWRAAADLWCAAWFSANPGLTSRATFSALMDSHLRGGSSLPEHVAAPLQHEARAIASRLGCFHWPLEFPEVFHGADGRTLDHAGFDAVLGNPPWEVLRGDRGGTEARRSAHAAGAALTAFTRSGGIYHLQGNGHANLYQLFLERGLSLLRRGGRIGVVLPSGFMNDAGCAALRRHVLEGTAIDTFVGIENRDGVFPIHRGLKFLLVSGTTGAATHTLPCRLGVRSPTALDGMPDTGIVAGSVQIPRALIARTSPADAAIPELRTVEDMSVLSAVVFRVPALGSADGWNLHFSRELNSTDDRPHFTESTRGLPVVEGKQIRPFAVDVAASRYHIPPGAAARLLRRRGSFQQPRLAYRDVASATNRLTLIAAIVPAGVVTTHTLFCLRGEPREEVHFFLCGVFNSYVANYLVRLRVGTHVTATIIDWLPVPKPPRDSSEFADIAELTRTLTGNPADAAVHARLQARCATLYGLTGAQFRHVVDGFPLIPAEDRNRAVQAFA